ncbi:MAG: zinc-dependent alcohol dehydrogenase family protein [Chromatiales bacterium]|jgi:NADPH:quinone reductase-like Zn-dependent oxidoreductase
MKNQAIMFDRLGGPEVLHVAEFDEPEPGPGEVCIRCTSAGLNRAELLFREGHYLRMPDLPSRSGKEAGGIVEAIGPGVTRFKPGDRVGSLPGMLDESRQGAVARYVTAPERLFVHTPSSVSDADAGGIWMQYLTAWGALQFVNKCGEGQNVVICAASSSVGIAAIQIANMFGATAIATTTSAAKVEPLRALGASHVIDVTDGDYLPRIREISSGRGADIVFDPVGGPMLSEHLEACRPEGWYFLYGLLDTREMTLPAGPLIGKNLHVRGYTVFTLLQHDQATAAAVHGISEGLDSGKLGLHVDRYFPLEETAAAHRYMAANAHLGKIIINP